MSNIKWPKCSSCDHEGFSFDSGDEYSVELHSKDAMIITTRCRICGEYTIANLSYDVMEILP